MSGYTPIEPDVPTNAIPGNNSSNTTNTNINNNNNNTTTYNTIPGGNVEGSTTETRLSLDPNDWTLYQRLKESSHPVALLFYIMFRILPIFIYIFGNFFIGFITKKNRFILHFITLILLNAADFWNLKNVSGRLLVGLRWWNEINQIDKSGRFENVWVFETADPNRYINPIDSKVFWILLYGQPISWILLSILAILKLQFLYLILTIITISLSLTNAIAFTRCDKFGKANDVANGIFGRARSSLISRFNPFG